MREYSKKPESQSRTLDSNPQASRQAPIDVILQRYKERNIQRFADEEELIQGKFDIAQRTEIDEDEVLQDKFESVSSDKHESIQREEKPNNTGLSDSLKTCIENLSGYSMDDVKVYYNSDKPAQLNALAYAHGTNIDIAPGQEKHLPHELGHIVQQKRGDVTPTAYLNSMPVNLDQKLESDADKIFNNNTPYPNKKFSSRISDYSPIQLMSVATKIGTGEPGYTYERHKKEGWIILKKLNLLTKSDDAKLVDIQRELEQQILNIKKLLGDNLEGKTIKDLRDVGEYSKVEDVYSDEHKFEGLKKIADKAAEKIESRQGEAGPHIALSKVGETLYIAINSHTPFNKTKDERRADDKVVNEYGDFLDDDDKILGYKSKKVDKKNKYVRAYATPETSGGVYNAPTQEEEDIKKIKEYQYGLVDGHPPKAPIDLAKKSSKVEVKSHTHVLQNSLLEWAVRGSIKELSELPEHDISPTIQWIKNIHEKITNYKVIGMKEKYAEVDKAIMHGEMLIAEHIKAVKPDRKTHPKGKLRVARFGGTQKDCLDCNTHFHGGLLSTTALGATGKDVSSHTDKFVPSTTTPSKIDAFSQSYSEMFTPADSLQSTVRSQRGTTAFEGVCNIDENGHTIRCITPLP